MTGAGRSEGVRPPVALAFAVVAFVALLIFGLGMLSLALDAEVIAVPGLGQAPGAVGTALATAGFAAALWATLRRTHPSFVGALGCVVGAFLGYVAGVLLGAVLTGADIAAATAAAGGVATGWSGAVVAGAGLVAGWGGIALVRTRAQRPRWPWEHDDEE